LHLWGDIQQCAKEHTPTNARNAKSHFLKIISVNKSKRREIPDLFAQCAEKATMVAHGACDNIPPAYRIDYITSFKYSCSKGKLTGHCDKVTGWVVLFSLGCAANFWVKGKEMRSKHSFAFESGDVLIFNGGSEFNIQHGITSISAGTAPSHFQGSLDEWRVSIQFRQCERNDNFSYRGYYKKKS